MTKRIPEGRRRSLLFSVFTRLFHEEAPLALFLTSGSDVISPADESPDLLPIEAYVLHPSNVADLDEKRDRRAEFELLALARPDIL
jgi:hypothetical protein